MTQEIQASVTTKAGNFTFPVTGIKTPSQTKPAARNTIIRVIYDSSNIDSCLACIGVKALGGMIVPTIPGKVNEIHFQTIDAQHGQARANMFKEPDNTDILTFVLGVPLTAEELTNEADRCKNRNRGIGGPNLIYIRYTNDHSVQSLRTEKSSYFSPRQNASKRLKDLSTLSVIHEIHPAYYGEKIEDSMAESIYLMLVNFMDTQYKALHRSLKPSQEARRDVMESAGITMSSIDVEVLHSLIDYQNFKTQTLMKDQVKQLRRVCGLRTPIQHLAALDKRIYPAMIAEATGSVVFKQMKELCSGEEFLGLVKNIINRNMGFLFYKTTHGFFNLPTVCIPREFSHESLRRMRLAHRTAVTYEDCRYTRYYRIQSEDMAFARSVAESLNPKEIWVENKVVCCCVDKSQQHMVKS